MTTWQVVRQGGVSTSNRPLALPEARPVRVGPSAWLVRLLVGLLLVPVTGLLALSAVAMTGWGFETEPVDQLRRDLPMLIASAIAGAGCGAALGFALAGRRGAPILSLMALGVVPAVLKGTAFFTHSY